MASSDSPIGPARATELKQALTGNAEQLRHIVRQADLEVVRAALKNVHCCEEHLLLIAQRPDLDGLFCKTLCKHSLVRRKPVALALVRHPQLPPLQLKTVLQWLQLFDLVRLCQQPGLHQDVRVAAERAIIERLPGCPLGNRISLARRTGSAVLQALIQEGQPQVVEACLDNPHLKEAALYLLLNGPNASPQVIRLIASHPRWQRRPHLQRAIARNSQTPADLFRQLLSSLPAEEIRNLLLSQRLGARQKSWLRSFLGQN
ncbi:hypothetical protein [Desulfuromonas thiophila]|uniref:hypothetical protein n=1 Tax=Desulfuromonas thiophila TaxID=57664 RepID=UPI0024A9FAF8|nr:hypothetical protein [Desulfuromonas thiophila]